jgi:catechol 2,3-dioxygenase-like lactoylglutathione lyase family enzyme
MKKWVPLLGILTLSPSPVLWAQLDPPNEAGAVFAQWGTIVSDIDATKRFWTVLGGKSLQIDGTAVIKVPGVYIFLKKGNPTGGSFGSAVNHVGFLVPDDKAAVEKWSSQGATAEYAHSVFVPASLGWAYTPDNLKVEINADKNIAVPITSPHVHIWVPNSARPEVSKWYAEMFGGKLVPGNEGNFRLDGVPGVRLYTANAEDPRAFSPRSVGLINGALPSLDSPIFKGLTKLPVPTKGRTLDHIGFEVKNLESFCKRLEAKGVKFDQPYSKKRHKSFASAEFTDPWGVSIELTEGLDRF